MKTHLSSPLLKLLAVLAIVLTLAALAVPAQAQRELSPAEVKELAQRLEQLRTQHPNMRADFREQRQSAAMAQPVVTQGTLHFQAPERFRREVRGATPIVTVSNGNQLLIYYPNFKEAEVYDLGKRKEVDESLAALLAGLNFQRLEDFYNLRAAALADGGYSVVLTPKRRNLRRLIQSLTVVLNKELNVLQTDHVDGTGNRTVVSYSNHSRANIPASTFEFTPPAGTKIKKQ